MAAAGARSGTPLARIKAALDDLPGWLRAQDDASLGEPLIDRPTVEPADPSLPLARAPRLVAGKVVKPGAGMGIDDPKCRLLRLQSLDDERQHRMLDHIGKVPGMERMAIVHAILSREARRASTRTP